MDLLIRLKMICDIFVKAEASRREIYKKYTSLTLTILNLDGPYSNFNENTGGQQMMMSAAFYPWPK